MYTYFMKPQKGEIWQHYKTKGEYEIIDIGKLQTKIDSLDMQECVIYKSCTDGNTWVRPVEDFIENITTEEGVTVSRFEKTRNI